MHTYSYNVRHHRNRYTLNKSQEFRPSRDLRCLVFLYLDNDEDRLVGTHWFVDVGAKECTADLAAELRCPAVCAQYSRLLLDLNRPLASPTLIRTDADGPIEMNKDITSEQAVKRLQDHYVPYHHTVGQIAESVRPRLLVSMHTFTGSYEGGPARQLEVGVLNSVGDGGAVSNALTESLNGAGYITEVDEPYSAVSG